jgi:hypothetical protein
MRAIIISVLLMGAAPALAADYVVIPLHADIAAPADAAWAKVGDFCAIQTFAKLPCKLASGTGGVGSIRSLANGVIEEPMLARTSHSYTYGQIVGTNKGLDYHGTLAIEPTGPATSRVDYTLVYDQALLPADKRDAMRTQLPSRFQVFVDAIKAMAEAK